MKCSRSAISDVLIFEPVTHEDDRGYFMETFRLSYFHSEGINVQFVQDNQSMSKKGTLRGLHYQLEFPQGKLVRAVIGTILDVAVDIRLGSPTYGKYIKVELSAENKKMVYVPEGFAHGYLVLSDKSIISYKCTNFYNPNDEYGIKWNDKTIDVDWGNNSPIISKKDDNLPFLKYQKLLPKY